MERLVQWEYVPGYRKVPGVIYARRYRVLEGSSGYGTVYEFASTGCARKPGVEGATATFFAQFAAHAAGHDARTEFPRGLRAGELGSWMHPSPALRR